MARRVKFFLSELGPGIHVYLPVEEMELVDIRADMVPNNISRALSIGHIHLP